MERDLDRVLRFRLSQSGTGQGGAGHEQRRRRPSETSCAVSLETLRRERAETITPHDAGKPIKPAVRRQSPPAIADLTLPRRALVNEEKQVARPRHAARIAVSGRGGLERGYRCHDRPELPPGLAGGRGPAAWRGQEAGVVPGELADPEGHCGADGTPLRGYRHAPATRRRSRRYRAGPPQDSPEGGSPLRSGPAWPGGACGSDWGSSAVIPDVEALSRLAATSRTQSTYAPAAGQPFARATSTTVSLNTTDSGAPAIAAWMYHADAAAPVDHRPVPNAGRFEVA